MKTIDSAIKARNLICKALGKKVRSLSPYPGSSNPYASYQRLEILMLKPSERQITAVLKKHGFAGKRIMRCNEVVVTFHNGFVTIVGPKAAKFIRLPPAYCD